MSAVRDEAVHEICARFGNDATRLLDVVRAINQRLDCIDGEAMEAIAEALHLTRADVEGVVSFYSFSPLALTATSSSACATTSSTR